MSSHLLAALLFLLCSLSLFAQTQSIPLTAGPVLPLYRALGSVGLDPQRVFTIREAVLDREDIHIWLNDGTMAFTQAVDGRVTGAYFEGDGEVLVRPPDRMERASLGLFTGAGVLEERFSSAYLRFNDNTAKELEPYLRPPQEAVDFVSHNDEKARALARMDATRLCISFTSAPVVPAGDAPPVPDRLLHVIVAGEHYGVFDISFDTRSPEQVMVGKASAPRPNDVYYDLWMSFPMRSLRKTPLSDTRFGGPSGPLWTPDVMSISKYTITARLDPPRELTADATLDVQVKQGGTRMVLFELSRYLQLKQVEFEGRPLEFIQNEAIEGSEMSRNGNDTVAVVFPAPLQSGAHFQLRFSYAGTVIADAGGGLLYVGARGTWYPNRGIAMADYDLTFRFPRPWSLIATGKRVSLERNGNDFVGHWISEKPIPIAGFNLGEYIRSSAKSGEIAVEAFAARGTEYRRAAPIAGERSQLQSPHAPGTLDPVPDPPPLPNPASTGELLANRAAGTLTDLAQMLGPYPFSSLSLTENPNATSQGWPGLIFLSSYSYLSHEQLDTINLTPLDRVIYSEIMMPHELTHQWYGDEVSWASYHEQWLLEALANYCSILLLERNRPADVQFLLEGYRQILGKESKDGRRQVVAGPVTLGMRLSSSMFPNGYEIVAYGRGTWLMHMLREMLRDASRSTANPAGDDTVFLGLLRGLVDRYQGKEITNADFEQAVEEVLPRSLWFENRQSLDWFFDGWVNGTAFPQLELGEVKFSRTAGAASVNGVIRQKSAPPDLVTSVPVYGVEGDRDIYLGRIFAEGDETHFSLPAPAEVKQLVLDPYQTVLTAP